MGWLRDNNTTCGAKQMEVGDQVTVLGVGGVRTIERIIPPVRGLTVLVLDDGSYIDTSMIVRYTPRQAPVVKRTQKAPLMKLGNGR